MRGTVRVRARAVHMRGSDCSGVQHGGWHKGDGEGEGWGHAHERW